MPTRIFEKSKPKANITTLPDLGMDKKDFVALIAAYRITFYNGIETYGFDFTIEAFNKCSIEKSISRKRL